MNTKKIREVDLKMIADGESLTGKAYRISQKYGRPHHFTVTASDDETDYVATISYKPEGLTDEDLLITNRQDEIRILQTLRLDEDGFPYYLITVDGQEIRNYHRLDGWLHLYEKRINYIFGLVKRKNEYWWVLKRFNNFVGSVVDKIPDIKQAMDRRRLMGDDSELEQFSPLEVEAFKYVMKTVYFDEEFDKDLDGIDLDARSYHGLIFHDSVRGALFYEWYTEFFVRNPEFDDRIFETEKRLKEIEEQYRSQIIEELESNGFLNVTDELDT